MKSDCTQNSPAVQHAALELFQTAALLLGNETEAVLAVEDTLAAMQMNPCAEPAAARRDALAQLIDRSIARAKALYAGALTAPDEAAAVAHATCIDTDDLSAAGLRQDELMRLMEHSGRDRMRSWLESLSPAPRIIFVLRAILGLDNDASARHLHTAGAGDWTPAQVSQCFREALCSLASSLVHAAAAPAVA